MEQYTQARDACVANLFQLLGQKYGVSAEQVRQALGQRRLGTDLLIMLSYGAVYAIFAYVIVRWLWRRIGQEDPSRATVISVFVSLVVALIGTIAGEIWCDGLEMVRLGNGHLSYRETRVPWTHHRLELFFCGVLLFLILAALQWFRVRDHQTDTG